MGRVMSIERRILSDLLSDEGPTVTKNEFVALCGEYGIDPGIALEDEDVVAALQAKDADAVRKALEENF